MSWTHGTEKVSFTLRPPMQWVKTAVGAESGLELFRGRLLTDHSAGTVLGKDQSSEAKGSKSCPSESPVERWVRGSLVPSSTWGCLRQGGS